MKSLKIFHLINPSSSHGFTMIEILVSFGILAILGSLGLFLSFDVYRGYAFRYERGIAVSILQTARSKAINNISAMPHGVHIESGNYTMFQGSTFDPATSTNIVIPISRNVTVSGSNEIKFEQLSGEVLIPGSITITDNLRTATISINHEGGINW